MFPQDYQDLIQSYLSTQSTKQLSQSFQKLSQGYRAFDNASLGMSKEDVDAYLVGRLPLTYAVCAHLLEMISSYFSSSISVIDYGSGPGTAILAIHSAFSDKDVTYVGVEEKQAMIDAASFISSKLNMHASFVKHDVCYKPSSSFDLAIVSYVLNELSDQKDFFHHILFHHDSILVIEPGTPDGTKRILELRDMAIEAGMHIVMPCPHEMECPLKEPKWCHFFKRVERSKILKTIKGGTLGYEDEKFMYLFLSKKHSSSSRGVVLEKPKILPHMVELNVCAKTGQIEKVPIMKKDKEAFKSAKKLDWGDFI